MLRNDENQILKIIQYTPPLIIILVSIIITALIYFDYKETIKNEKNEIRTSFINEHKKIIKQDIHTAVNYTQREFNTTEKKLKKELKKQIFNAKSIISSIYENNKNIKTKEEITQLIKNALYSYRFNDGRGYFFINSMEGIRVFHPIFPKKEGENISEKKDILGEVRFQKVKKVIEDKGYGFETFYFFNPNRKNEEQQKLAYVEYFEPYNWMIGTGEYMEEFEKAIKERALQFLSDMDLGENKYYIVMDYNGTTILHPDEKFLGKTFQQNQKEEKFTKFFNTLKNNLKFAQGYFEFKNSIHPTKSTLEKKIYYFKKFPRWEWIILTGFYEKDVNKQITKKEKYLDDKYSKYINTAFIASLILTTLLLILSFYISKVLKKKFERYRAKLHKEISKNISQKDKLLKAQEVAKIGDWELNIKTMKAIWSKQILKIFGMDESPNNIGPEYLKELILDDDWTCFENSIQNTINTGKMHKCQYRIKRPDGEIKWIECRGTLNKEKKTINGIIQDITENKKLEIEKHEKEDILYQQSKLAAMGEMIGNIAHQWRQPLSTISTASTGVKLQKELELLTDEEFNHSMDTINRSVQYLSQTIDDFRYFFSPTNEKTHFRLNDAVEKTLNLINAQFTAKDIEIIKEVEDIEIFSLENELIQVLINILNNARDALLQNQENRKLIFIKIYKKEDFICIQILDNAKGINKQLMKRVFEPYFTTKHKAQGTGIGLYMSEEIINKHLQGKIELDNKVFKFEGEEYTGANFKIFLKNLVD